jgi:hypothetical protein
MLNPFFLNPMLPRSSSLHNLAPAESSDSLFDKPASLSSLVRPHHSQVTVTEPKSSNLKPARSSRRRTRDGVTVERGKVGASSTIVAASESSSHTSGVKFVPGYSAIRELVNGCQDQMKIKLFDESLLPSNEALITLVDSSWRTVAAQQSNGKYSNFD